MPVKSIKHPITGQTVRFGRKRPVVHFPRLSLGNYLMKSLPAPPSTVDYSPDAMAALGLMYENDTLGDCVIAAQAHLVGVFTGNANSGSPVIFSDGQIISRYSQIGGYVPGDSSTDNGCDMQVALAFWQQHGMMPAHPMVNKHRIAGWMAVNPASMTEMMTALWLFENLSIGMELPDKWVSPFPSTSGFVWNVAGPADPNNGHNVPGLGYSSAGVMIDSWGMLGTLTWDAVAEYAASKNGGELYTVIATDTIEKAQQKAPAGFDFSQLMADFDSLKVAA